MKRIAVVDRKKCKQEKCGEPCIRFCPRVRSGDEAIVLKEKKIYIAEELCIGCGICSRKCPYNAITIVNLPSEPKKMVHRYGKNSFRLYGLPVPEKGKVVGLLGANGTGKTTALKILSGQLVPNLGKYEETPCWEGIIESYRGTSLHTYLKSLSAGKIKTVYKPQQVDMIASMFSGTAREHIKDEKGTLKEISQILGIEDALDKKLSELSGGELQRVAICAALCRKAEVYFIDEPSSFLDVRQRLSVARVIRKISETAYVIVVEHDLATLDFLADIIYIIYGTPGAYGVVSTAYATRRGINCYLDGYAPDENVRFRNHKLEFRTGEQLFVGKNVRLKYEDSFIRIGGFCLDIKHGVFYDGEVIAVFGENALGKTTFAKMLAGKIKPQKGGVKERIKISYKPQYIEARFSGSVYELLKRSCKSFGTKEFKAEISAPLGIERMMEQEVSSLSGGELQKVAVAICLEQDTSFYLLDEPSAYLDVEERINLARIIRRFIERKKKPCLVIDHDIMFLNYIADRAIVFRGVPSKKGFADTPCGLREGMNHFLSLLNVTFRRDPQTNRPRANKPLSQKEMEQKARGEYYL